MERTFNFSGTQEKNAGRAQKISRQMGGTLAAKSVRHAFEVLAEIREAKGMRRET
ncbi:MAG: hypothetical protein HY766_05065 [candidate division NC10 bacterium]|nr:hypothetical protein [candidate division NC10 bacterium]